MFAPEHIFSTGRVPLIGAMLALAVSGAPKPTAAQAGQIVSNRVTVSDSDASLFLGFDSGDGVEISFRNGSIRVDGEEIGSFEANGELEASWRALLSEVIALDDRALAASLRDWEPGDGMTGEAQVAAERLDETLEEFLAEPAANAASGLQAVLSAQAEGAAEGMDPGQLRLLLERGSELQEALRGVDLAPLSLYVGEDVTVDGNSEVAGTLVVVEGDVTVRGEVAGDVVVVGGTVRISGDARIRGDVRLIDGALERNGGAVEGDIRTVGGLDAADEEAEAAPAQARDRGGETGFRPLRYIMSGLSGLFGDAFGLMIVLALGFMAVHFAGDRLQNVADVARASPGRAALVGLAGGFLLLPVWVLGGLGLLVSIIGIPLLVVWIPLFPLAALLAQGVGYLAVAVAVGEWLARKGIPALERIRPSNQLHVLAAGAGALALPSAFSHVSEMGGPSLGAFLNGLFTFVAVATTVAALMVGFGAVLLTGAGRTSNLAEMAASYGSRYRATRAWTRRRSRRNVREDYRQPGGDPDGPQSPDPGSASEGDPQ